MSYLPAPHVRSVQDEDGAVLLDLDKGIYYSLNPTASIIWEGIREGRSRQDLIRQLSADFDAGRQLAARDVERMVESLTERGLIESSTSHRSDA